MGNNLSTGGSTLAATLMVIVSSACCVGPLAVVLSFVGLSTTTMLSVENVFGPFRPYILSLTILFLGVGFYAAYRRGRVTCEDGAVCAIPGTLRFQRLLLWVATLLLLVLLYFTFIHPNLDLYFDIYL